MKYDIFLSICQTEVDGFAPTEQVMFDQFFDQVKLADELGYETAWIAETHLSCQVQKENSYSVIPHFTGEIGLNTDILQMAHVIFSKTKNINVGSAIRNILCNGGPIAHAEAVKTFLSLRRMSAPEDKRKLKFGFASGRFEFSNRPYGIAPRNAVEESAWPIVKGKVLSQATEIFYRLLKGEHLSSDMVSPTCITYSNFRSEEDWLKTSEAYKELYGKELKQSDKIEVPCYWNFEKVGVIPFDAPLELLELILGSHDSALQGKCNEYLPTKVFNLSITPSHIIEETHKRMSHIFHKDGGSWQRDFMPRTAMVFLSDDPSLSDEENTAVAKKKAQSAWENYWTAMEGTIDNKKVEQAVQNTLAGSPKVLAEKIKEKYHPDDRLMLWFDFNNHDNEDLKKSMRTFVEKVAPIVNG